MTIFFNYIIVRFPCREILSAAEVRQGPASAAVERSVIPKMNMIELILIAVGLSMDAFAVSVCKGLASEKVTPKNLLTIGLWFGGFQALMPALGYLLGSSFQSYISAFDHWVAFALLTFIGVNMIREAREKKNSEKRTPCSASRSVDESSAGEKSPGDKSQRNNSPGENDDGSFAPRGMLILALATSIDALAVGITFALLPNVNILAAVLTIGMITFLLSGAGLEMGHLFGLKYQARAELAGGCILILIGIKILTGHLGLIPF